MKIAAPITADLGDDLKKLGTEAWDAGADIYNSDAVQNLLGDGLELLDDAYCMSADALEDAMKLAQVLLQEQFDVVGRREE